MAEIMRSVGKGDGKDKGNDTPKGDGKGKGKGGGKVKGKGTPPSKMPAATAKDVAHVVARAAWLEGAASTS